MNTESFKKGKNDRYPFFTDTYEGNDVVTRSYVGIPTCYFSVTKHCNVAKSRPLISLFFRATFIELKSKKLAEFTYVCNILGNEHFSLNIRLLIGYQTAFIYNDSNVLCVPVRGSTEAVDIDQLDFSHGGNNILGAGYSCDGQGLLFSVASGMITVQPSHQPSRDKSK